MTTGGGAVEKELADALNGYPEPVHLEIPTLYLDRLESLDRRVDALDRMTAEALKLHADTAVRLSSSATGY